MNVLITGANGFLGSHLIEKSLHKGFSTTAMMRPTANNKNLEHLDGFDRVEVDYNSSDQITAALTQSGPQDLIIHNAGLTKSYTLEKYIQVNVGITENLIRAIKQAGALKENGRLVYVSSLAAKGPVGNGGPASNYGVSKLKAEEVVKRSGLKYMIFRPAGIYGSRDIQFVPLIKAVRLGLYPTMSSPAHKMTLINARDVAENILTCSLTHANEIVHLEDGHIYQHRDMKESLESVLHKKSRNVNVPKPVVRTVLFLSDILDRTFGRTPRLSLEHYNEISQDWDHDFSEERKRIPLKIDFPLTEGFKEAVTFYQEKKFL